MPILGDQNVSKTKAGEDKQWVNVAEGHPSLSALCRCAPRDRREKGAVAQSE